MEKLSNTGSQILYPLLKLSSKISLVLPMEQLQLLFSLLLVPQAD